jgi:hypothetical protein
MIAIMEYARAGGQVAGEGDRSMRIVLIGATIIGALSSAQAQEHADHTPVTATELSEPGQSAFAAIQEAVARISADAQTDWSTVNIEALREHLIDMDEVTLRASIRVEEISGGARFHVSGEGRTREAIRRMVVGHARSMNDDAHWRLAVAETTTGAVVTATGKAPGDEARIRALGLIGIMAAGSHHQPHHLLLATGADPHH